MQDTQTIVQAEELELGKPLTLRPLKLGNRTIFRLSLIELPDDMCHITMDNGRLNFGPFRQSDVPAIIGLVKALGGCSLV